MSSSESDQPVIDTVETTPPSKRKGVGPGCLLLLVAGLLVLGGAGYRAWVGWKMHQEIAQFSQKEPSWQPVVALDEQQANLFQPRWDAFVANLEADKPAAIALSIEEINHLIATEKLYKPWHKLIFFTGFVERGGKVLLQADICFPLPGFGFSKKPQSYINGEILFVPSANENGPWLKIREMKSARNGVLPQTITDNYNQTDLLFSALRDQRNNLRASAALELVQYFVVDSGKLVIATDEVTAKKLAESKAR